MSRVDVFVETPEGQQPIGSVLTDKLGNYSGHVTIPRSISVGVFSFSAEVAGGCE
jgi:hypothetical protein